MSEPIEAFEGWAVVELMGHRKLAGFCREVAQFGGSFLRLDVPGPESGFSATQFYGAASIYCITPTTEELARALAKRTQPAPVTAWELPAPAYKVETDNDDPEDEEDGVDDSFARDRVF